MGFLLKEIMADALCSKDEIAEAILLGEWQIAEETQYDPAIGKHCTVSVTVSHYNGKIYVLNSKTGIKVV